MASALADLRATAGWLGICAPCVVVQMVVSSEARCRGLVELVWREVAILAAGVARATRHVPAARPPDGSKEGNGGHGRCHGHPWHLRRHGHP